MAASESSAEASFLPLADPKRLWGIKANSVDELRANERRVANDMLRLFIANRTPLTLWGPVGARKTRTIESLSREKDENGKNYQVITLQPSTQDPTIIHGMMYTSREGDRTVMRRSTPRVAEDIMAYAAEGGLTILFADEMTTCMPSQQNAMLGLLTHGKFEDADISKHIAIVMAANPEGTVSSVIPLNEAVMNRGGHIAWYGDAKLFVDEWSTGFDDARERPQQATVKFVEAMFKQNPSAVFRSKRWKPDGLVPWDMMEHTERAVTELADLVELIGRVFSDVDVSIRDYYVIQATKALLGREWADAAQAVVDQVSDMQSKAGVLDWVRKVGLKTLIESDDLDEIVAEHGSAWSDGLRHDQAAATLEELVAGVIPEKGQFSPDHYFGAWAFVSSSPAEGDLGGLDKHLGELALSGLEANSSARLTKENLVPAFVPRSVKSAAGASAKRIREQRSASDSTT